MATNPLDDLVADAYADEVAIGSFITIESVYTETLVSGEVIGIERTNGYRVTHPEADYDYLVFTNYKIKIAGFKRWFHIEPADKLGKEWKILVKSDEQNAKKLSKMKRKEEY